MERSAGVPIERLLEHRDWVRRLARALVRDESRADDVEQDAWLAAMRHPPQHDAGIKSWLRRLVRHRAANARRSATRRGAHELLTPPPPPPRRPDDAVAQIEETERVARAVLSLEEPYRTAIALRFYEQLEPREIAARTREPVETVRTRIKRALAKLRERLDEEHGGDGRAWCAALLPLAASAARAKASLVTGGIAVTTKTKLTIAAAVLLVLALGASVTLTTLGRGAQPTHDIASGEDLAAVPAPKTSARADAKPENTLPAAPAGTGAIVGAVRFGETKKAANGQRVTLATPGFAAAETSTDEAGRFLFEQVAETLPWRVDVAAEGFARVVRPSLRLERAEVRDVGVLWLDAPGRLVFAVKDWSDRPVAGAAVELQPDFERGYMFDSWTMAANLRAALDPFAVATTGADGRATFPSLPRGTWAAVVRAKGYAIAVRSSLDTRPNETGDEIGVRLDRGGPVTGRVLRADRSPAPGIAVWCPTGNWYLGAATAPHTVTGPDGAFVLDGLPYGDVRLFCGAPGTPPADGALIRVPAGAPVEIVLDGKVHEGRVTDAADGAPVAGARVRLSLIARKNRGSWVAEAVSGEDGRYRLDTIIDAIASTFRVERAGYALLSEEPADVPEAVRLSATRDFALRRGVRVAGTVAGPDGPVAGARVAASWLAGTSGLAHVYGFTDDGGRFAIDGIPPTTIVVRATSDPLFQTGLSANWIGELLWHKKPAGSVDVPETGLADVAIALVPGVTVTGRVEAENGGPAAGAIVRSSWVVAKTGDDGAFRIAVEPRAEGASLTANRGAACSEPVRVATERATDGVVLRLAPPIRFTGRVTGPDGVVPAATSVQVVYTPRWQPMNPPSEQWWARVPVVDGRYVAEIAPSAGSDGTVRLRASAPGFTSVDSPSVALPLDRAEYTADLTLAPSRPLEGRVVSTTDHAAVAGARLSILPANWAPDPNDSVPRALGAVTGADGRFRMDEVANGNLKVELTHDEFVRTVVPVTAPADGLVIELEPAQEIAGTVRFAGGAPIANAGVTCKREYDNSPDNWRWATSGPDGRFRIGGLASGTYVVSVMQPRDGASARPWERAGVAAGTKDLDVAMEAAAQISGRVVDPAGHPVAGWSVQALSETGDRYTPSDRTKADGTFTVRGLNAGSYALVANLQGDAKFLPCRVTGVAAGASGVEIKLSAGETIRGRLVDASGAPVRAALLRADELQTADPWTRSSDTPAVYTEATGAFAFERVPPGRYRIVQVIEANTFGGVRPLRGGEDVASGATDVRLVAGADATITGTVVDEEGRPVADAAVTATPVGGGPRCGATTDAKGAFTIANASDLVRYSLVTSVEDRPPAFAKDVAPGATGVVLKVPRTRETTGRVLLADGKPYANAYVEFSLEGTDWRTSAKTDAEGRFTASTLPDGVLRVEESFSVRRYGDRMTPRTCGTIHAGDKDVELKFTE